MNKYERLYVSFTDAKHESRRIKLHPLLEKMHIDARECATAVHAKWSNEWYQAWYEGLGVIVTSPTCDKRVKKWFDTRGFTF